MLKYRLIVPMAPESIAKDNLSLDAIIHQYLTSTHDIINVCQKSFNTRNDHNILTKNCPMESSLSLSIYLSFWSIVPTIATLPGLPIMKN